MAVKTLVATAAQSGIEPRAIHAGVNAVFSKYVITASLSASHIINFARVPDGARMVSAELDVPAKQKNLVITLGRSSSAAEFLSVDVSASAGGVYSWPGAEGFTKVGSLGTKWDTTDAAANHWTMLIGTITTSASGTGSGTIGCMVTYYMDGI
jgi:hypothetical protein